MLERRAITVVGTVQGVGFRPFVWRLATDLGLAGWVRNRGGEVEIEVEGDEEKIHLFVLQLAKGAPVLARIGGISEAKQEVVGEDSFRIVESGGGAGKGVAVAADVAVCADCLREMRDPEDRRFGYAFINCTNCGPRLTIVKGAPYDRGRTTMAGFAMCADCRREYEDPRDRRFHAQPIACAACGPRLALWDREGRVLETGDVTADFATAILQGGIGALKGIGGFHLVCDAGNAEAVSELRRRKHRDEKPFAVMVLDVAAAREICEVGAAEEAAMTSARRPIVLMKRRAGGVVADGVAPGCGELGVMLAYSPLHVWLMEAVGRKVLVMTSGNRSDEPMVSEEAEVVERLKGIADSFLVHNRGIYVGCDDSVVRVVGGVERMLRRARGYAPEAVRVPVDCAGVLAVGGQMKSVFGLGCGRGLVLSHHLGDLDHLPALRGFEKNVELYEQLFAVRPRVVAHDLHPDYASTRYALKRSAAGADSLKLVGVQHHHAHLASCMAENMLEKEVIGVTFDGTGWGLDGAVWGGEFLVGDYAGFRRAGHLRYVGMPGGDRAAREPWRMAVSYLRDAGISDSKFAIPPIVSGVTLAGVLRMLEKGVNCPQTSSMGRLFDAVASLVGVRDVLSYEGQAAMQLETLARGAEPAGCYPFELVEEAGVWVVDVREMIAAIVAERALAADRIARRFHATVAAIAVEVCRRIRAETGLNRVVLSGGVFVNALLSVEASRRLEEERFEVYQHHLVPANDGGLSLGQAVVAAASIL